MNSRAIIGMLKADDRYRVGVSGSHRRFKHPEKRGRVAVPHPRQDVPIKTIKSIERQSGVKLR
ncbi:MAG TPA: type II toxin-antitoxin system HicA family toxin [Geminicoccaceae bacterium]|nr:type II toxin-antitoxin system HicA family toxin [Geminicoccaceae bacterium]